MAHLVAIGVAVVAALGFFSVTTGFFKGSAAWTAEIWVGDLGFWALIWWGFERKWVWVWWFWRREWVEREDDELLARAIF